MPITLSATTLGAHVGRTAAHAHERGSVDLACVIVAGTLISIASVIAARTSVPTPQESPRFEPAAAQSAAASRASFPHETWFFDAFDPISLDRIAAGARLERASIDRERPGVMLAPASADASGEAVFELAPQTPSRPFREALVSWNVDAPAGTGFVVELCVSAESGAADSAWLQVGQWGTVPDEPRVVVCALGRIDVDFFRSDRELVHLQVRLRAFRTDARSPGALRVERVAVCTSDRAGLGDVDLAPEPERPLPVVRLAVPFLSQRAEAAELAARICSPTSLAMVMAYRGVARPTAEVAARVYDPEHDLYGNWPRNVQAAYSFGVPGYLDRFTRWDDVGDVVRAGQPLILSIRANEGELTGAPYATTSGHLLVLTGFDENGDCLVNDPAAATAEVGMLTYRRSDLTRVWMQNGGVAYVLVPRK